MLVPCNQALHPPNTSRGELESNRLELASNTWSCRTHCLWSQRSQTVVAPLS